MTTLNAKRRDTKTLGEINKLRLDGFVPGIDLSNLSLFISPEVLVSLFFAIKVVILNSILKKCFLTYQ